ncbi:MAG: TonB-dependent receptor, partial [Bryobacteraceae bacterium]|nr:TonB-dependent receptor [Bryobacteraceae bacterium]
AERGLVDTDKNNFAPRVGLAWSLTPRTVVRTGYGVSYVHWNRVGSSYLTLNPPFTVYGTALNIPTLPGFRTTQQGIPAGFADPQNYDPTVAVIQYMPRDTKTASVQSWFLSVQRELMKNFLVDVAYVGNSSNNLVLMNDLNQAFPNPPGQTLPSNFRRPIRNRASIVGIMPWGFSRYNGLQVKLERRSAAGLYFLNSFTWSRTIDNGSQNLDGGPSEGGNDVPSVQNIYDLNADRGLSAYDRKFVNVTSIVYELPLLKRNRFLGGWQLTAIGNVRSGIPITLTHTPGLANEVSPLISVVGRNQSRANVSGNPLLPEGQRGPDAYLDRTKVSAPTAQQPFGNSGRNTLLGPAFWQVDLGVHKTFGITERLRLQFRAESFNALNRTNFGVPDGNISNPTFGTFRRTFDPRQFQSALKFLF